MNCLDLRRTLGAEPAATSPDISAHLAECAACARYADELRRFDALILRALKLPVPVAAHPMPAARPAPHAAAGRRWFALAAGLASTAVLAGLIWSFYPQAALASALVGHMRHEPDAWARSSTPAAGEALRYTLGRAGVTLDANAPLVSYVHSCLFRHWFVPHLVVQTAAGPMTVMVLIHERVEARTRIDEGGYRGVIVPAPKGAYAVLAPAGTDAAAIDAVAAQVAAAVHYIG